MHRTCIFLTFVGRFHDFSWAKIHSATRFQPLKVLSNKTSYQEDTLLLVEIGKHYIGVPFLFCNWVVPSSSPMGGAYQPLSHGLPWWERPIYQLPYPQSLTQVIQVRIGYLISFLNAPLGTWIQDGTWKIRGPKDDVNFWIWPFFFAWKRVVSSLFMDDFLMESPGSQVLGCSWPRQQCGQAAFDWSCWDKGGACGWW